MVNVFPEPNLKLISINQACKDIKIDDYIELKPGTITFNCWEKAKPGDQLSKFHPNGNLFGFIKVNPKQPAPTLTKGGDSGYCPFMHWLEPRTLSINELKVICSFPVNFKFPNNLKFRAKKDRLGNAVMPKMMEAIASQIINYLKGCGVNKEQYTVISMFAGCGGSSLGYKWAGFKELLAIDFEKNAVETFALNFPDVPVWQRDIKTVSVQEVLNFCQIKIGDLDVLDGSPPCQGFSTAGKRQVNDDRNDLFKEYVRLIDGLQPKIFVMENVSGMIKGKMKGKFIEIMTTLKGLNYNVKCKLMNAKYYNVPQSRERLIFIGVRKDLSLEPSFPKENNKLITVKEALKNIKQNLDGCLLKDTWQMKRVLDGIEKKKHFGLVRIDLNKPSNTIVKDAGNTATGIIHPIENRRLSIPEIKRLSSFPDEFKTIGTYKEQWARIGNSVMPKFMQAIAENIKVNILDKINGEK